MSFVGVIVVLVALLVHQDLRDAQRVTRDMYEESTGALDLVGELQFQMQETRRSLLYALTTLDAEKQVEFAEMSRSADARVAAALERYSSSGITNNRAQLFGRVRERWNAYLRVRDEMIAYILENNVAAAVERDSSSAGPAFERVQEALKQIQANLKAEARQQLVAVAGMYDSSLTKLGIVLAGLLIFGLVAVLAVHRSALLRLEQAGEARTRLIVDAALDAVVTIDGLGRITGWNPQAERTFGWTRAEALGRVLSETIVPERFRSAHEEGLKRFATTGKGQSVNRRIEVPVLHRDGREFPAELAITPIESDGKISFSAFIRDISDRKRAESELDRLHKEVVNSSRQAGMAEVASGVLHNVGNVLNSVNVTATLLQERLATSKVANLSKAATLLREHENDLGRYLTEDPKGKLVPGYLTKLAGHLEMDRQECAQELKDLAKNVEHIKEIVAMQQSYARAAGLVEMHAVPDLIEDALRINQAGLERHRVRVVREFGAAPMILVDRHKVLQILVNLISNAKYALDFAQTEVRTLTLRAVHDGTRVRIEVSDTGVGIGQEDLTKIFAHGFTTKKDGHGFGLHMGALAAKEMGGSLSAHSDGPGRGATFTLILPTGPIQRA